ncbi:MAG: winged helix-turn-helix transcriptional regulator [Planctomycetaceae bacterium]|nr:winged helix-turn-helix transcriptional regulator [Planctomycetaceae bacterium]
MSTLDSRDREIIEHLHRTAGADIQSLCDELGVTRTAVRQRIARLEASGLLACEKRSQTRGRPKNVYRVTAEGLHSLGEDYRELAVVLWESIVGLEESDVKERLILQVQERLADRFRKRLAVSESVEQSVDELADEMRASGFNVESDHSMALPILRETNCPFPMLADVDETICQIERRVLEEVIGAPVEFRNRCRDGHHCCEFEVQVAEETPGNSL